MFAIGMAAAAAGKGTMALAHTRRGLVIRLVSAEAGDGRV